VKTKIVDMKDLPRLLRLEAEKAPKIGKLAIKRAARRLRDYLRELTDELGINDTGAYRKGFVALDDRVENTAPHAPIVEEGARPHDVGVAGRLAIKSWAMRKLGLDEKEAERASFAIANKIKIEGQVGHFLMRDSSPTALEFFAQEFERLMKESS
jgi:hypothetical protein